MSSKAKKREESGVPRAKPLPPEHSRFKPGNQAGKGHGRPRKTALDEALRAQLAENNNAEVLAQSILKRAKAGSHQMAKLVAERTQGKPVQVVKLDGDLGVTVSDVDTRIAEILNAAEARVAESRGKATPSGTVGTT